MKNVWMKQVKKAVLLGLIALPGSLFGSTDTTATTTETRGIKHTGCRTPGRTVADQTTIKYATTNNEEIICRLTPLSSEQAEAFICDFENLLSAGITITPIKITIENNDPKRSIFLDKDDYLSLDDIGVSSISKKRLLKLYQQSINDYRKDSIIRVVRALGCGLVGILGSTIVAIHEKETCKLPSFLPGFLGIVGLGSATSIGYDMYKIAKTSNRWKCAQKKIDTISNGTTLYNKLDPVKEEEEKEEVVVEHDPFEDITNLDNFDAPEKASEPKDRTLVITYSPRTKHYKINPKQIFEDILIVIHPASTKNILQIATPKLSYSIIEKVQ